MAWYKDPQSFILGFTSGFYLIRVAKEFSNDLIKGSDRSNYDGSGNLSFSQLFSQYLYLGYNKESDYDAFKATFPQSGNLFKHINSQGLVITWDYAKQTGTWSKEEPDSPFWSLPGITKPKSVIEQALEKKKEALEAENANLKAQANRERGDEILAGLEALGKQVLDLTLKPVHCCGGAGVGSSVEEPWTTGHTVPSNWVSFRDLDVEPFSKNIPLMITKATGGLKFGDDNTTNVRASHFYGGIFPIVVVHIAELTPDREEARFDPDVWSRYVNAGIEYAARKPFPSEMSIDAHKMC
ncbi:hypothetical protein MKW94_002472 [Papaver nudicaule]|uniref:Uncharacterized protein n=1 Tax=Papaver nudicaule TaxID=74823 RepID=A0AA41VP02_PAPNU|nr:hypothetical protein [Papaver nudicaule]